MDKHRDTAYKTAGWQQRSSKFTANQIMKRTALLILKLWECARGEDSILPPLKFSGLLAAKSPRGVQPSKRGCGGMDDRPGYSRDQAIRPS